MKLKNYSWVLEGITAIILLAAVVVMFIRQDELNALVIQLIGIGVLFFTVMRIKPILASRNEKDFVIIMVLEFVLSLVVGFVMLFLAQKVLTSDIYSFSRLTGVVIYTRGIVHFYTTTKRYELNDMVSFIANILLISFGFLFLFNTLKETYVVWIIYALSFLLIGYFSYRSFNGYSRFRLQKMNELKLQNYSEKKKQPKVEDPKQIEEKINPKVYNEPEEERPTVDVN